MRSSRVYVRGSASRSGSSTTTSTRKGTGVDAQAVAYIEMIVDGHELWGCGIHGDITTASMRAIVSAINRARAKASA